jgi:glycyl-tRNA synthetase
MKCFYFFTRILYLFSNFRSTFRQFFNLIFDFNCQYEEKDSIGKRYRRQDAIGTPFCITVDHQTLEDNTVTLRDRDTMKQERVSLNKLHAIIAKKITISNYLD